MSKGSYAEAQSPNKATRAALAEAMEALRVAQPNANALSGAELVSIVQGERNVTAQLSDMWRDPSSYVIAEKTAITVGVGQVADQVIGTLAIPAGSLAVGDIFRVQFAVGKDNSTNAYGTATNLRMGVAGTVADSAIQPVFNLSSEMSGTGRTMGFEKWFTVVSIGTDSVISILGSVSSRSSFIANVSASTFANAQYTLTGYNLSTQDGCLSVTTTMAGTTTIPETQFMRLERVNSVTRQEWPKTVMLAQSKATFVRTGVNSAADATSLAAYSFSADLSNVEIGDVLRFRTLLRCDASAILKQAYLTIDGTQASNTILTAANALRQGIDLRFWVTDDGLVCDGSNGTTNPATITPFTPGVRDFVFYVAFSAATTDDMTLYGFRLERE